MDTPNRDSVSCWPCCWQPGGCAALPAQLGLHRDMVSKGRLGYQFTKSIFTVPLIWGFLLLFFPLAQID